MAAALPARAAPASQANLKGHLVRPLPRTVPHYGPDDSVIPTRIAATRPKSRRLRTSHTAEHSTESGAAVAAPAQALSWKEGKASASFETTQTTQVVQPGSVSFSLSALNASVDPPPSPSPAAINRLTSEVLDWHTNLQFREVQRTLRHEARLRDAFREEALAAARAEIDNCRAACAKQIEEERNLRSQLEAQNAGLRIQIHEAHAQLVRERDRALIQLRQQDDAAAKLQKDIESRNGEIDKYRTTIQALKEEIGAFRKDTEARESTFREQITQQQIVNAAREADLKRENEVLRASCETQVRELRALLAQPVKGRFISAELEQLRDQLFEERVQRAALEASVSGLTAELLRVRGLPIATHAWKATVAEDQTTSCAELKPVDVDTSSEATETKAALKTPPVVLHTRRSSLRGGRSGARDEHRTSVSLPGTAS